MNSYYQILALLFNIVYGLSFAMIIRLFYKLFGKEPILLFTIMLTFLNVDLLFLYLVAIYKLFFGIFNYYYLLFFLFGICFSLYIKNRVNLA